MTNVHRERVQVGAVKRCTVLDVIRTPRITGLVCQPDGESAVAHICLYRPWDVAAEPGDRGTLTFAAGGPLGGYWQFEGE